MRGRPYGAENPGEPATVGQHPINPNPGLLDLFIVGFFKEEIAASRISLIGALALAAIPVIGVLCVLLAIVVSYFVYLGRIVAGWQV